MKITIAPTEEFFSVPNTMVRAWRGTDEAGADVIALIAGISTPSESAKRDLTPIPPPLPNASFDTLFAMAVFWGSLNRLNDDQALRVLRGGVILTETLLDWRIGFHRIAADWLDCDFEELTSRIEQLATWSATNAPLTEDEQATVKLMIERQIALGPSLFSDPNKI